MTDLDLYQPDLAVHPWTQEAIDLTAAPDDILARALVEWKQDGDTLYQARRILEEEALRRMDANASWTLRAGPYRLTAPSPAPEEHFDALALRNALLELVDARELTIQAVDQVVETVVTYKVRKSGINALRKLGGRVKEIVDAHSFTADRRRYVRAERVERLATYDGTSG